MNIRSIIGISAFTPYIVASSLLISSACAPKTRFRGPVTLSGISNLTKPQEKVETRAIVEIYVNGKKQEFADPKKNAASEKLETEVTSTNVESASDNAKVVITMKDGSTAEVDLAQKEPSESKLPGDLNLKQSCLDEACNSKAIILSNSVGGELALVTQSSTEAAVVTGPADDADDAEKLTSKKLSEVETARVTTLQNIRTSKKTVAVTLVKALAESSTIALDLTNIDMKSAIGTEVKISKNVNLDIITKAVTSSYMTDDTLLINLFNPETQYNAELKVGKEALKVLTAKHAAAVKAADSVPQVDVETAAGAIGNQEQPQVPSINDGKAKADAINEVGIEEAAGLLGTAELPDGQADLTTVGIKVNP